MPFCLWIRASRIHFSQFEGWFSGFEKKALKLRDYSVAGLEAVCAVERKDLSDLVHSCTVDRRGFIDRLRAMARPPHRLLVITSTLSQIKSPYSHGNVDPNRITQFLIATLTGLQVPFVCSETHELGEELVASYLCQVHLHHWLECNDYGRFLIDDESVRMSEVSSVDGIFADHNGRHCRFPKLSDARARRRFRLCQAHFS